MRGKGKLLLIVFWLSRQKRHVNGSVCSRCSLTMSTSAILCHPYHIIVPRKKLGLRIYVGDRPEVGDCIIQNNQYKDK